MSENKVLVYVDQFKGVVLPASWEVFTAAFTLTAKLGGDVIALVLGAGSEAVAAEAFKYGAEQVFYADDETLADYRPEPYADLVTKVVKEQDVDIPDLDTSNPEKGHNEQRKYCNQTICEDNHRTSFPTVDQAPDNRAQHDLRQQFHDCPRRQHRGAAGRDGHIPDQGKVHQRTAQKGKNLPAPDREEK